MSPSHCLHTRSPARHGIPLSSNNPGNRAMEWMFFFKIFALFLITYMSVWIYAHKHGASRGQSWDLEVVGSRHGCWQQNLGPLPEQ